jgi:hypothetical protein
MRRYYFQIKSVNVLECIWADSFVDAKAKASMEWMPLWREIEWLTPQAVWCERTAGVAS